MVLPTPPEGLRHWRPDDAEQLAAAWADPSIAAWNEVPDLDAADPDAARREALAWIAGTEIRWTQRRALDLVVLDPGDDSRVAGEVGLAGFAAVADGGERAELGVWVHRDLRRSGVAARAVRAVTEWATTSIGLRQVWCRVDEDNFAALGLFARLDWTRLGGRDGMSIWTAPSQVLR